MAVMRRGKLLNGNEPNQWQKPIYRTPWLWVVGVIFILLMGFLIVGCEMPAQAYTLDQWANAIHKAEGNDNYGILTKRYGTNYRQICKNTVLNNYKRWERSGQDISFLQFLGNRYCPVGASNDPYGFNRFWIKNVGYYLTHGG